MSDDSKTTGLTPYSGPKPGKPGPRDVLALLQRKCELRALLEEQQSKIDLALPYLDQQQTQELLSSPGAFLPLTTTLIEAPAIYIDKSRGRGSARPEPLSRSARLLVQPRKWRQDPTGPIRIGRLEASLAGCLPSQGRGPQPICPIKIGLRGINRRSAAPLFDIIELRRSELRKRNRPTFGRFLRKELNRQNAAKSL